MKRVFHIVSHFDLGGAEKVAVNIASSKSTNIEYHLVEVVRGGGRFSNEFVKDLQERGIQYHRSRVRNNKIGIILFPLWFLLIVFRYKPNIIHTHTEIPDLSVYIFHVLFGWMFPKIQYVRTIHNTILWNEWGRIGTIIESFFIKNKSSIAIGKSVQDFYRNQYGDLVPIIQNGVEETEQKPFEQLDRFKTNILFAGRLEYQKGIDQLLQVVKAFENDKSLVFWIVGSGSLYEQVHTNIQNIDNVHYCEKIFGLPTYLSSFDYLFMPSNFEGLPLTCIEASLAKVPSIINACPGLENTLPTDWPLKVNNNNVARFIEILSNLKKDRKQDLGIQAYMYVKENFSIELMQKHYEEFYFKKT